MQHTSKRAFTLIELLVVISIIALLIAILLPALSKARHAAEVVQCQSAIRQMTVALSNYCINNDGWFPRQDPAVSTADTDFWRAAIPPYIGLDGVSTSNANWYKSGKYRQVVCPSRLTGNASVIFPTFPHVMFSINWGLVTTYRDEPGAPLNTGPANTSKIVVSARLEHIQKPSDIFMFIDGGYNLAARSPSTDLRTIATAGNTLSSPHHDGFGNSMSFVDGHATHESTDQQYVYDPRARWNLKSAWLPNSEGYGVAVAD